MLFRLLIHIFNLFLYFVKYAFTKVKSESGDVKTVYEFTDTYKPLNNYNMKNTGFFKSALMLLVLLVGFAAKSQAQNIQLHYDMRRNCATSTVEMFRADNYGSTFFFIDMDFAPKAFGAYGEISREFCFWKDSKLNWLSAHIEYNGGLNNTMSFNNAWLLGATYSGHSKDWSKTWSVSAMYKLIPGTQGFLGESSNMAVHNFQVTAVWNLDFLEHWLSFNGFADFWRETRAWQGTKYIFIAEPQLWVNLNKVKGMEKANLSVGTEVELSNNFVAKGFDVMPTVAVKYAF